MESLRIMIIIKTTKATCSLYIFSDFICMCTALSLERVARKYAILYKAVTCPWVVRKGRFLFSSNLSVFSELSVVGCIYLCNVEGEINPADNVINEGFSIFHADLTKQLSHFCLVL